MSLKRVESGVTLIELIVVIAIVGIVASIALPSYDNYVKRTKVADALIINSEAHMALIAYHAKYKKFVPSHSDLSKRNLEIGLSSNDSYESDDILSMWIGSAGVKGADSSSAHIAIMLNPDLNVSKRKGWARLLSTIEYKDGEYLFVCNNTNARWASNIKEEYLPEYCHN